MWGPAAASTTLLSGARLTLFYLWQRDIGMVMLAHSGADLYGIVIAPGAPGGA